MTYLIRYCLFFITAFIGLPLLAATPSADSSEQGEIMVRLSTQNSLLPLYLSRINGDNSRFPAAYLKQLEEILRYDLDHNGMTGLVKSSNELDTLAWKGGFEAGAAKKDWEGVSLYYLIRSKVKDNELSTRILSVNSGVMKKIDGITLTGSLDKDRKNIHELADAIHQTLFGKQGIASTHLLYTVRNADPNQKGNWLSEVWEADWDGKNAVQITQSKTYCLTPAYLPPKPGFASASIFYVAYQTAQPKIFMTSLKGFSPARLTTVRGNQLMPAISLDRSKVAFVCDALGNPDLFVQDFNPETGPIGKPYQIYATLNGSQGSPCFSPDGKKIAFVSNKSGSPQIYVMDLPPPGSQLKDIKPRLLTRLCGESTSPSWSPDGTKIAFSGKSNGVRQIWIYDLDANREYQLTQGQGHKENPSWAPNSLHIVFNSAMPNSCDLFIINLNQKEAVKITRGGGESRFPAWEPRQIR